MKHWSQIEKVLLWYNSYRTCNLLFSLYKIGYEKFWLKLKDFGQALHCIYAACLRFDRKKDTANAKCSIY